VTHPSDPQSVAFREATESDHWDDDVNALIAQEGAVYHDEATSIDQIRGPDAYETEDWDADRDGPKTIGEARVALADRIADPEAPDTDAEAGAYDEGA
jgi:hypothetical protein